MILPGGGSRLQTWGGLASQLFDSALRTFDIRWVHHYMITSTVARHGLFLLLGIGRVRVRVRVGVRVRGRVGDGSMPIVVCVL